MRRRRCTTVLAALVAAGVLAGCAGDTDPASDVRSTQATLNAHGRTNNGPAYWWWEYSQVRATVENGQGTKTPRTGPASSSSDVALNRTVTGLSRLQRYYFRACGQDQKAGSPVTCGGIRSFGTAAGDTTVGRGSTTFEYNGAQTARHALSITTSGGNLIFTTQVDEEVTPPLGSALVPSAASKCTFSRGGTIDASHSYADTARCLEDGPINVITGPFGDSVNTRDVPSDHFVSVRLGAGDDYFNAPDSGRVIAYGEAGNDSLVGFHGSNTLNGGPGDDTIIGGDGPDTIDGGDGDDHLYGGAGADTYNCGPGDDTVYDVYADLAVAPGCEHYVFESQAATMRQRVRSVAAARGAQRELSRAVSRPRQPSAIGSSARPR